MPHCPLAESDSRFSPEGLCCSKSSSTTLSTRCVNRTLYQYSPPSREQLMTRPCSLVERSCTASTSLNRGSGSIMQRLSKAIIMFYTLTYTALAPRTNLFCPRILFSPRLLEALTQATNWLCRDKPRRQSLPPGPDQP